MRFRKLRIAWSVLWGLAAVLLIVLWVRSYRVADAVQWATSTGIFTATSATGVIGVSKTNHVGVQKRTWNSLEIMHGTLRAWSVSSDSNGTYLRFPHRWPLLIFAIFAAVPWINQLTRRFSLRTLLIATTLVAVVLGLIVWSIS